MNRGDIWLAELGGKIGTRPVVILTRQNVLPHLNKVTVAEVTTNGKGYPTEVFIGQKANLPKIPFVQTDNIHTIPKQRFVRHIGTLDEITMQEGSRKIIIALQLEGCF
jgi:mRNA-degrading endonuclease toxin of MazEF toxin-antitoxin module